jgi:hypothetical protein
MFHMARHYRTCLLRTEESNPLTLAGSRRRARLYGALFIYEERFKKQQVTYEKYRMFAFTIFIVTSHL